MEDAAIQNMVEEDRLRFHVGGGRLHFRRAQAHEGYDYLRADGDIAVLHCCDGQEATTHMTCVVLSRHRADETPVYVGQCVSCGTVWIAEEPETQPDAARPEKAGVCREKLQRQKGARV